MPFPTVLIYSVLGKGKCHSFPQIHIQNLGKIVVNINDSTYDNYTNFRLACSASFSIPFVAGAVMGFAI